VGVVDPYGDRWVTKMGTIDWPPSNYPIFLALVLLVATAVTLALGDESRAEEFSIYAYYLLVIGVPIRFFELSSTDHSLWKIGSAKQRALGLAGKLGRWTGERIPSAIVPTASRRVLKACEFVSGAKVWAGQNASVLHVSYLIDFSKDVALFLSVTFLLISVYGSMYGWWIVRGYLERLVLIILGFVTLYVLCSIFIRISKSDPP